VRGSRLAELGTRTGGRVGEKGTGLGGQRWTTIMIRGGDKFDALL